MKRSRFTEEQITAERLTTSDTEAPLEMSSEAWSCISRNFPLQTSLAHSKPSRDIRRQTMTQLRCSSDHIQSSDPRKSVELSLWVF